ncbi:hypothetical protein [Ekhidna sp. To15]|uniref:hypothetical protein n=1 Tax=Ekhidna sp. To15 TaxID=3395267 RepID=UPI003F52637D
MKKITLLFLALIFCFSCEETAENIKPIDEKSSLEDESIHLLRPRLPGAEATVFLQVQNLNVPFGTGITVVYTAAGTSRIRLYLERRRVRQYPFGLTSHYFSGVPETQKVFLQTLEFTNDVNSGTVIINQPPNIYYDNNYVIKAYDNSNSVLLATSNQFTIGNHGLSLATVNSSTKFYENSPGLVNYSSNMDPYTLMIIEINRPGEKIKRFVTNNISSDFQIYGFTSRNYWGGISLIGKLSDLKAGDINDVLFPPLTNIFSNTDYIIKIYPYGYSNISDQISNIEFVESKTEWNTPQTPYLTQKTYSAISNNLFMDSRHPATHPYGKLRYDLYLNGKFYKVLSGPTTNGYSLHLPLLKYYNSSPYAIWRVKATYVDSNGYMSNISSMIYINPSWLN